MNTLRINLFSLCFLLTISGFSQEKKVKEKFRAQNGQTINVVKNDKANDKEILNEQFDLASIGMNEEVRIYRNQAASLNVAPAKESRTTEVAVTKSSSPKSSYVPKSSGRRVKMKKVRLKKRRKNKRYKGTCYAF